MPTYYTPPQTPIPSPPSSLPSLSRSNSFSNSTSASSRSSKPSKHSSSSTTTKHDDDHSHHKTPYIFLGSIAAASVLAHKYWPRGFPHGDKEDWELSKYALRAKERHQAEKAARRGGGSTREFLPSTAYADDERELRYEDYYKRGRRGGREGCYVPRDREGDREYGREWAREQPFSRARSRSRDRGRDRYDEGMGGSSYRHTTSTTRSTSRERHHHRPSAPQRYLLEEESTSTSRPSAPASRYLIEPSTSSRFPSGGRSQPKYEYYDRDRPEEVVYVYRDAPIRSRRVSFDAGAGRRYEGDYDRYYR